MNLSSKHRLVLSTVMFTLLYSSPYTVAQAADNNKANLFGISNPVTLDNLPSGLLRSQLETLSNDAQKNALRWLNRIDFHNHDLPYMQADKDGGIFFVDPGHPDEEHGHTQQTDSASGNSAANPESDFVAPMEAFALHSKPGATNVIYLDFDGHIITDTAWNSEFDRLDALAYDLDGDANSFTNTELNNIGQIWRRIAEDYAAFDVDVTTEEPTVFGPTTGRLLITKNVDANNNAMPAPFAGGVAYVGVWGRADYASRFSPALVYYNNLGNGRADYVTEAASHEMGHNMGLTHDGTSSRSYYSGHGDGAISWGPIMGVGYGRNVSQWSKGEYADANQFQDDIQLIANKVRFRSDDHGDQSGAATDLRVGQDGRVMSADLLLDPHAQDQANKGVIGSRNDVDVFRFSTSGGDIKLQAKPALETTFTKGGNLDIALSLYDENGSLLGSSDPFDDTSAEISRSLEGGTYYLSVTGVGSSNYTDYGSMGRYFLSGTVPLPVINQPPEAENDTAQVAVQESVAIDVLANDRDPENDALRIIAVSGAEKGRISTDGHMVTYTAGNRDGTDRFSYTIEDSAGNTVSANIEVNIARPVDDDNDNNSGNNDADNDDGKRGIGVHFQLSGNVRIGNAAQVNTSAGVYLRKR